MNPIVEYYLFPASPVLSLFIFGILLIAIECVFPKRLPFLKLFTGLMGPVISIYCTWILHHSWPIAFSTTGFTGEPSWLMQFGKEFHLDPSTLAIFWAINIFTFFGIVFLHSKFKGRGPFFEAIILMEFIASGMLLLVSANSLLMVFLGLELMSLPTYVLVGIQHKEKQSLEAALKYFLYGSLASVFLVLGAALLYAHFGTMNMTQIGDLLRAHTLGTAEQKALVYGGLVLFLISGCFKVGIAPFHMWVPDVYQGAPTTVTGYMGSAIKLAGFGLMMRLFWGMFLPLHGVWSETVLILAVLTMFVGNLAALAQSDLKRLFAYSSVAHAGYLLLGISAFGKAGPNPEILYYYLTVYGFMFLGFFATLHLIEEHTKGTRLEDLSGVGLTHPVLGACLSIFALSAAGIPPTSGFLAKYFLLMEAVSAGKTVYVVLAVISSLIGVYYYLKILVYLYMKEGKERLVLKAQDRMAWLSILACAFCVLYFTVFPSRLGM